MRSRFGCWLAALLLVSLLGIAPALAQGPSGQSTADPAAAAPSPGPGTAERIAKLEAQVADAKSSADNSWMLTSSALVLVMAAPEYLVQK